MKKQIGIIASIVVAIGLVAGAVYFTGTKDSNKTYTLESLASHDGKDGRRCLVAVEGVVYEIAQGRLWKDGEHTSSQGQAYCGQDLTRSIGASPHGSAKLKLLPVVGSLK